MKPNKFTPVEKTKLYKSIKFFRSYDGLFIPKDSISSYAELEYLTVLYALGYVSDGGAGFFVKIR